MVSIDYLEIWKNSKESDCFPSVHTNLTDLPGENCITANIWQSSGTIPDEVNTPCHKRKITSSYSLRGLLDIVTSKTWGWKLEEFVENDTIRYVLPLWGVTIYIYKLPCNYCIMILFKITAYIALFVTDFKPFCWIHAVNYKLIQTQRWFPE
jgi:hypothetical protein